MIFERLKSKVVSHLSYMIGAGTEVFVVDPQRDVQPYIDLAKNTALTSNISSRPTGTRIISSVVSSFPIRLVLRYGTGCGQISSMGIN